MDSLDGLLGDVSGSSNRVAQSREAIREPRVNFIEHSNKGSTYGFTRVKG